MVFALTGPTRPIGEVEADVVVRTGERTERSAREALEDLEDAVDRDLQDVADVWGETLADGISEKLSKSAPDIASEFDTAMSKQRVVGFTFQTDKDGNVVRRWVRTELIDPIKDAVTNESKKGGGGLFGKIGQGMADAIGAGFNVSGKSPLIAVLFFAIGYIIELVIGAIQAVGALIGLLYIIPGLILSIALQAGVLMIVFDGVGSAIQGAFAAKNAEELNAAIKDLTPSAQEFVKSLLPFKDFYANLKTGLQESFFIGLGDAATQLLDALNGLDRVTLSDLAGELGELFRYVTSWVNNPQTQKMINGLIASTAYWVQGLQSALGWLIPGFNDLVIAATPFMNWFGEQFNNGLADLGKWLSEISEGPLQYFLEDIKSTLAELWGFLGALIGLGVQLWKSINKANGDEVIGKITEQIERLTFFLSTPMGQKGIEGLIRLVTVLSDAFFGLIMLAFLLLAVWESFWDLFEFFNPTVTYTRDTVKEALTTVGEFFTMVGTKIETALTTVQTVWTSALAAIRDSAYTIFGSVGNFISSQMNYVGYVVGNLPAIIMNALGNIGAMLYNAGASAMQSFINGLLSKLGPLGSAMVIIAGKVSAYIPHSPAKEGPLSGGGDPLRSGQTIVERLAAGIEMGESRITNASDNMVSNIIFGAGAIQNSFYGPTPTQNQASGIGAGIGNGISGILAQRDARLTVRAMG